jgi:hypothetical protein
MPMLAPRSKSAAAGERERAVRGDDGVLLGGAARRAVGAGERDPDAIADAEAINSGAELVDDAGAIMVRNRRLRDLPAGRAAA